MTRFRNRIGEAGAEELLKETIAAGLKLKAITPHQLKRINVDKRRRGSTARSEWKWMKRRAAIEPGIGHLKREHRMDRCRLKRIEGDQFNAILSAAGMNFGKLLKAASRLPAFLRLVFARLFNVLKEVLRTLRSEIFSSNQLDPAFAVL